MEISLNNSGLISFRPMSKEEYLKHNKEAEEEWARLEIVSTRLVLFEKYSEPELYRRLRKIMNNPTKIS